MYDSENLTFQLKLKIVKKLFILLLHRHLLFEVIKLTSTRTLPHQHVSSCILKRLQKMLTD